MHHGKGLGPARARPVRMSHADRLALAFRRGAEPCPRRGAPRAPRRALRLPRSRPAAAGWLRAELPPAPRRARRRRPRRRRPRRGPGGDGRGQPRPAAAPRTSATSPAASSCCRPAARWSSTAPRPTASTASPARSARALPLDGAFVKAHGRVVLADPPGGAARRPSRPGRAAAAPRRNAEGFLTAPGMFSPDQADPGSRRLAAAFAGRLTGRVADLGAGWGWLAQAALARSPRHHRARPLRGRGPGARRRPRQRPRPPRPLPLEPTSTAPRRRACRPTTR